MDFNKLAVTAMRAGKRVSLTYKSEQRIVEIHAIGISTAGRPCVRVYQVMGGSSSGEETGWKMLSLAHINNAKLMDDSSLAPRQGYSPNDKGMSTVLTEVIDYAQVPHKTDTS